MYSTDIAKISKLSKTFRALGNPLKLKLYASILEEACECNLDEKGQIYGNCVTELAKKHNLNQPTVSNLIKDLINADLVFQQKQGKNIYLFGNPNFVTELKVFNQFVEEEISGHK